MHSIFRSSVHLTSGLALAFSTAGAFAQAYPVKPLRMVTQFVAGSGGDALIRLMATPLAENLGQAVIIENRAGAGGIVAAEVVARAAPDGYTFLAATPNIPVVRVAAESKMSFDPQKDLVPLTAVASTPSIFIVNPSLPVNSYRELMDYAKKFPDKLSYGTSGVGSAHHLAAEQIRMLTGIQLVHVPYKAGQQALLDVVTGQIPTSWVILGEAVPLAKAGKIRVLVTREEKRVSAFPDVPAIGELVPGFEPLPGWTGLFTPANVPQPVFRRLSGDVMKSLQLPETRAKINQIGFEVSANTPEQFAAQIKREIALTARIAKAAGIKLGD
jgi:tripartite-type tricarboxylate transporter receptor subunit TctC